MSAAGEWTADDQVTVTLKVTVTSGVRENADKITRAVAVRWR